MTKEVSDISAESIMYKNGYPVNYKIELCPSRGIERIAAVPTDIVIAVDNSRSLSNINESAILAVQALVDGISKNDKQKITRLGLVSWSDKGFSKTQVPLTNDYNSVASSAKNIVFPEGDHTDYQEAVNSALLAFQGKESDASRTKKIVIITDANDSGYIAPSNVPGPDYTIYAIVVGNNIGVTPYEMLDSLTRNHQGYIRSINNISELQEALIQMATAGSKIKNVHLVETLPNYLILNNATAEDDSGKIQINGDSNEWTTTTISWDVGDLSGCWNTTFQAFFCWKLPADVNQPKLTSYVNYTDEKGERKIPVMGCYGIGTTRLVGAIVEASNDERGIIWPKEVAPYQIHLISLQSKDQAIQERVMDMASSLYDDLTKQGYEIIWDDRTDSSVGEKLADADLLGMPIRILVSAKTIEQDGVEFKLRNNASMRIIRLEDVVEELEAV